jgi:hypothetical protein
MMGSVRPFTAHDIPQVARLHQMVFPAGAGEPREPAAYEAYFRSVFLENPAGDAALPSLVYEGAGGRIVGFLGSVRRRMAMGHRRYEAAVSSQFIVDPSAPTGLVAVHLVKAFLEGPQDLSIADEATDTARRIWEGLGGTNWTRPLRPARLAMSFLRERPGLAPFAVAARPFTSALDTLATRVPGSHFRQIACADGAEEVCADAMAACAPDLHGDGRLRVEYDARTVEWLLDRAGNRRGRVLKAAFRNHRMVRLPSRRRRSRGGHPTRCDAVFRRRRTGSPFLPGLAPWSDRRQRTARRARRAGAVGSVLPVSSPWALDAHQRQQA